jgi:hypothetical protein
MKKIIYSVLVFFAVVSVSFPYASCNIDCEKPKTCDSVCVVRGPFSGTFTNQFNQSGAFAYTLADYNFTSG